MVCSLYKTFSENAHIYSSVSYFKHLAMEVKLTLLISMVFTLSQAFDNNGTCVTVSNDG